MTATTFTLVTTVPRPRPRRLAATAVRAVRAFGGAAVGVVLLGDLGPAGAGVRDPRPVHAPGADERLSG
ncbi:MULTISPECIES: hypothetical protein [Streptomyces]|uniref:hypothetical protein n=1 Tax=Streptomyces TaxID=1883 RepID=UPI0005BA4881|nr:MULTISPECIES: hypothetical protein [unclassified Streptomyces]MCM1950101.1 hypothetical protein [Streptomyces sp. G2]